MRKIEQKIVDAVRDGLDLTIGNTSVWFLSSGETDNPRPRSRVFLHNQHIATFCHNSGLLEVNRDTLRQWPTATTKSRLRALGAKVETRKGVVYLNGEAL